MKTRTTVYLEPAISEKIDDISKKSGLTVPKTIVLILYMALNADDVFIMLDRYFDKRKGVN